MKVQVQGGPVVTLSQSDFVAQGGQASVYVKGGTAYKIYTNPAHAIPREKVKALSSISDPNVIKPKTLLLGPKDENVGYAMDAVTANHSLCQLFVPAFRDRNKLGPEVPTALSARLRRHVAAVHASQILVVDLNELNVLVGAGFDALFLIDVDSYECPGFRATALMPSVQDWSATKKVPGKPAPVYEATELTDWYSYGVLAFQLYVGCHPYKGGLRGVSDFEAVPKDERLEWRARRHLSAFRREASLPACCPPFDVIPRHFRGWLEAVLDRGERSAPPDPSGTAPVLPSAPRTLRHLSSEGQLVVEKIDERRGVLLAYDAGLLLARQDGVPTASFEKMIHWSGDWMNALGTGQTFVGFTPKLQRPVAFRLDRAGSAEFFEFERKERQVLPLRVDELAKAGDRFVIRSGPSVIEVGFAELPGQTMVTLGHQLADVMPLSSRLFEGCVVQSLLGSTFVSLFPKPKAGYQVRVPELDGCKVLDAKFSSWGPLGTHGGVLMAIVARGADYERIVLRFDEKFDSYDARTVTGVEPSLVNLVVVPTSGAAAALVENDELEVFRALKGVGTPRKIQSPLLGGDLRLCRQGDGIGFTRGGELWRMRLK